jgi:cytochrome d ubiquinol oxidase subunit I
VTEVGRQPWVATGILRTVDAISPVAGWAVATTLALFVVVYAVVFSGGIYYINRLIARGPKDEAVDAPNEGMPSRPLASAHEATRAAINAPGE